MSSLNQLVEEALKEFMVNGYQGTSLSKITKKLGITKPALYYYFKSKKELFLACIDLFFERIGSHVFEFDADCVTSKSKLKAFLINFSNPVVYQNIDFELVGFNHYYFFFDAIKNVPEVLNLFMNASIGTMGTLQEIVESGIRNGEIRSDVDMEALLMTIGVMIEGFSVSYYVGYLEDQNGIIERVIDLLWRGLD